MRRGGIPDKKAQPKSGPNQNIGSNQNVGGSIGSGVSGLDNMADQVNDLIELDQEAAQQLPSHGSAE